ncbi:MAG: 2-oxo acid dehydrogenase subunit E2 [Deltaproteobacteria bacterium]|nr:2-oxo acid dehydrogenase subunit E2 [Deltaproteobacteria bacterium]
MAYEVILPKIDEAMTEGKIIEWMKQEGERVEKGTVLFTLETEKVTWEVESPAAGVLSKHLAKAGDVVTVGLVVAYILGEGEDMPQDLRKTGSSGAQQESSAVASVPEKLKIIQEEAISTDEKIKATPLAKKIAKSLPVDLSMVTGTGPGGRIKREDVERFAESRSQLQKTETKTGDIVALSSMRKTIARRMTESFQSVPHFFLTVEVDMEELKKVRESLLATIEKRTGIRITYTDLFIKMVARAVEDNPEVNVSWAGDALSLHHDIDIGVAVNVDNGLVVPVLKEANRKNLEEIAKNRSDLVDRARIGKLLPAEMKGGSLTISNLGMYGIDQFSPIINPPESCILGIGRMMEKPVVRNGAVIIRPMTNLTLSIDHRVLDGGSGSRFLQRISELIENPLLIM